MTGNGTADDGRHEAAPFHSWGAERDLQRRLRGAAGYRDDWRPRGCGRKLAEVVEAETGRRWLEVYCRSCSKKAGRDIFHYFPAERRPGAPGPRRDGTD